MELLRVLRILLRRWWLVLIPVIVTAALAAPDLLSRRAVSGGYEASIQYSAFQSMTAIPRQDGDYQDIWLSSELAINAFTDWVQGSSFKQEIAALADNADVSALTVRADNARSLGVITFYHPDSSQLETIVAAAIEVLRTRNHIYFAQLGGEPAEVTILSQTGVVAAPPPLTDRFGPFLRIGLGLLAGIGLALLAHYLDPVIRQREEIEAIGLPVIAVLPRN